MKNRYYFVYNSQTQPYTDGWTVVWADDVEQACDLFCAVHPRDENSQTDCAVYTEKEFNSTFQRRQSHNPAWRCNEIIEIAVTKLEEVS